MQSGQQAAGCSTQRDVSMLRQWPIATMVVAPANNFMESTAISHAVKLLSFYEMHP